MRLWLRRRLFALRLFFGRFELAEFTEVFIPPSRKPLRDEDGRLLLFRPGDFVGAKDLNELLEDIRRVERTLGL